MRQPSNIPFKNAISCDYLTFVNIIAITAILCVSLFYNRQQKEENTLPTPFYLSCSRLCFIVTATDYNLSLCSYCKWTANKFK